MWKRCSLREDLPPGVTLPPVAGGQNCRTQVQRGGNPQLLQDQIYCSLGDDVSRVPAATRNTVGYLSSRHLEVSRWQAHISDCISRVDWEMAALEQVRLVSQRCLQERQLYVQLMTGCVALSGGAPPEAPGGGGGAPGGPRGPRGPAGPGLLRAPEEEAQTREGRDLLQSQISLLMEKLSSLRSVRSHLLSDFRDKGEAVKLTTQCLSQEFEGPCSGLPAHVHKPAHVSYDRWQSNCQGLKMAADGLIRESAAFRGNLQFLLANLKNSQEHQRRSTDEALRRKIYELTRVQDTLMWEKQRTKEEISDLTKDIQKVAGQIRNCDSRLHQANHRLDVLNQRPGFELCLDNPHISLTLEKQDLTKMAAGLRCSLKQSQKELELSGRRLLVLDQRLALSAGALETERRCQKLHQSFLPALDTAVVLANRPKVAPPPTGPGPLAPLQ
ncbi:LOW QUALITY PROTEIN: tektin-B1-like [Menidia menidia]